MATELDPSTATLEDATILEEIVRLGCSRASVSRNAYRYIAYLNFRYNGVTLRKLRYLRDWILDLAPSFVNMDYPYWDFNWSKFPQMYSASYINRDADHNLNILPASGATFDTLSVELYRKFLTNVIYWLKKFRYTLADKTHYDMTFKRQWGWNQFMAPWYTGADYRWEYHENSGSTQDCDEGKLGELQASQAGVVDRNRPSANSASFSIGMSYNRNCNKFWSNKSEHQQLGLYYEDGWSYSISHVPHNLITDNPTGYKADLYWYIIPTTNWEDNTIGSKRDTITVTSRDGGTVETWGPSDNPYTGVYYSATGGQSEVQNEVGRRGVLHEYEYQLNTNTSYRIKLTNWSDDGSRSCVIRDDTEPSSYGAPGSNWNAISEYKFHTFNLVGNLSQNPPRFLASTLQPHSRYTFHVCDQSSLPEPTCGTPNLIFTGDDTFSWGIGSVCLHDIYCGTTWVPVFDFGEYGEDEEEEEEQQG